MVAKPIDWTTQKPWAARNENYILRVVWTLNEAASQLVRTGRPAAFLDLIGFYLFKSANLGAYDYTFVQMDPLVQVEVVYSSRIATEAVTKSILDAIQAIVIVRETYLVDEAAGTSPGH